MQLYLLELEALIMDGKLDALWGKQKISSQILGCQFSKLLTAPRIRTPTGILLLSILLKDHSFWVLPEIQGFPYGSSPTCT